MACFLCAEAKSVKLSDFYYLLFCGYCVFQKKCQTTLVSGFVTVTGFVTNNNGVVNNGVFHKGFSK